MMRSEQVLVVLERYFEGPQTGNALQAAGLGRCDGYNTGGLKGGQLFRCEVAASLTQLTRTQAKALAAYFHTWVAIKQKRVGEGADLDPRDDHRLKMMGREPATRHALMIMGRQLHLRLRA
jgi:hypothetical protein